MLIELEQFANRNTQIEKLSTNKTIRGFSVPTVPYVQPKTVFQDLRKITGNKIITPSGNYDQVENLNTGS